MSHDVIFYYFTAIKLSNDISNILYSLNNFQKVQSFSKVPNYNEIIENYAWAIMNYYSMIYRYIILVHILLAQKRVIAETNIQTKNIFI